MTTNLLKRLESSIESFRLTLQSLRANHSNTLAKISTFNETSDLSGIDSRINDLTDQLENLDADDDLPSIGDSEIGGKVKISLADMDLPSWEHELKVDLEIIDALLTSMNKITAADDAKLQHLKALVLDKIAAPLNPGNKKVLIFTAFADTADYLYANLAPELLATQALHSAKVTGKGAPKCTLKKSYDFQELLTLFSPQSKEKAIVLPNEVAEIDLLIGTDCISEGQNLQDCDYLINYDIHWNPVRIIQRFGRIDRIGSTNEVIQLVNFWPDISLDEYINLKERVENRMVIADLAGSADDNVLNPEDSDAAFRKEQLRRLQNENIELEDVRAGISITDLGLNDFRMDLLAYMSEYGDIAAAPRGLHAVIPADPAMGLLPGVIFALKNANAEPAVNRGNRLHPHYLVYVDDNGDVIADHTEAKRLLDLVRAGSRPHDEPVANVTRVFNESTHEGADMSKYSALLTDAIHSMIDVTEERDIESLFSGGHTTALTQQIAGLDDFELIAFIAVVDPTGHA